MGLRGREGLLLGLRRPAHPAPGQPDVLRHRRLVAQLRPHVPALRDAVRGRLAGQERQRLRLHDGHPGRPGPAHRRHRVLARATAPACRATRPSPRRWAPTSTSVLPVYGQHFADWWRDRLVPEMQRNFAYLEARLDAADEMSLAETATLLEDAIDIHDRHWKIHWMLNFAQLSATLDLRAVMEKIRGTRRRGAARAAAELGVGPELGLDRGAVADEERGPRRRRAAGGLRRRGRPTRSRQRSAGPSAAGGSSPSASSPTSASSAGTPSGATSSSSRPCASRWSRSSSSSAATSRPTTTTRAPIEAMRRDIAAASEEILEGLTGDALEEMRAANAVNLRMAPLTPDHHFYIDQGANAHLRLVLLAVGTEARRGRPPRPARRRAVPALQRAARR